MPRKQTNLEKYVRDDDLAGWFVSMSPIQSQAVYQLPGQLRDDFEQCSTYRTEDCLRKIGIFPPIGRQLIGRMLKLSRGNDLAFLFFTKEFCFNSEANTYTFNERLLCTAICKLDIEMTVRELDRILPPADLSKCNQAELRRLESIRAQPAKPVVHRKRKLKATFPYFQKQPRPKDQASNLHKALKKPNHIVEFRFWKNGESPEYRVTNDKRWFAHYKLDPTNRIIKNVVDVALENLFKCFDEAADDDDSIRMDPYDPSICGYHRFQNKEQEDQRNGVRIRARERCLKIIDVSARQRTLHIERIRKQLENDIDRYQSQYMNLNNLQYVPHIKVIQSERPHEIFEMAVQVPGPDPDIPKLITGEKCIGYAYGPRKSEMKNIRETAAVIDSFPVQDVDCLSLKKPKESVVAEPIKKKGKKDDTGKGKDKKVKGKGKGKGKKGPRQTGGAEVRCKRINKKKNASFCPVSIAGTCRERAATMEIIRNRYFTAPTAENPNYNFDFKRIFHLNKVADTTDAVINQYIITALNERDDPIVPENDEDSVQCEIARLNNYARSEIPANSDSLSSRSSNLLLSIGKDNVVKTVIKCIKFIWRQNMNERNAQLERTQRLSLQRGVMEPPAVLKYPDIEYFDPDDKALMEKLLKDGMAELRKDPRFVLASLPDSHKLNKLREWIKRRYGKFYTSQEIFNSFKSALNVFKTVMNLQTRVPLLDTMNMPTDTISYKYRDKMKQLAKKITAKYHKILNDALTLQLTSCWSAMGPYLCPSGPPRTLFYSYVPSYEHDIYRIHPWNSGDFRNLPEMRNVMVLKET